MNWFDDFPDSAILVRATVLAAGLASAPLAAATPPPPTPSTQAAVEALQALQSSGTATTEAEARTAALSAAKLAVVQRLRAQLPDTAAVLVDAEVATLPDSWLPLKPVAESVSPGPNDVTVVLEYEVDQAAWDALVARHGASGAAAYMRVGVGLRGEIRVIEDQGHGLRPGDELLRMNGVAVDSLEKAVELGSDRIAGPWIKIAFNRNGVEVEVDPELEQRQFQVAPTCGPCCHGHCDEDLIPPKIKNK